LAIAALTVLISAAVTFAQPAPAETGRPPADEELTAPEPGPPPLPPLEPGRHPKKVIIKKRFGPEHGGPEEHGLRDSRGGGNVVALAALALPAIFTAAVVIVVVIALYIGHRTAQLRFETITLALKEGKEIPPELFLVGRRRRDPTLTGLVLTALGIGLGVALGAVAAPVQATWGLIPFLMGVALLIYGRLRPKADNGNNA
jgi:hypothetical protein